MQNNCLFRASIIQQYLDPGIVLVCLANSFRSTPSVGCGRVVCPTTIDALIRFQKLELVGDASRKHYF